MTEKIRSERYVFVDALRGVAALGVVVYHLLLFASDPTRLAFSLPRPLATMLTCGALGVQIFFVLSGFVIAHSLRDNPLTRASIGNFMLRRQLRLDPPYWTVLVAALLLLIVESRIPSLKPEPVMSAWPTLLNFLYLQNIFGVGSIVNVSWTLCLEIQFYVFFILVLAFGKALQGKSAAEKNASMPEPQVPEMQTSEPQSIGLATLALVFGTGVLSLVAIHLPFGYAWFHHYWFYFAAGVLSYWAFRGVIGRNWFFAFISLYAASILWSVIFGASASERSYLVPLATPTPLTVGFVTALALWFVGSRGKLTRYGGNPFLQYLGKISYSLYLIHFPIIMLVLNVGHKITRGNHGAALLWMALALVISLLVAQMLHIAVEVPSMRLASRLKTRKSEDLPSEEHPSEERPVAAST